jgi:hypothetical protein
VSTATKRRIKAFIIKWEMRWYVITALLFLLCVVFLYVGAPTISTTTLAAIQLVCGFTATVAAAASSIKSNDTEE